MTVNVRRRYRTCIAGQMQSASLDLAGLGLKNEEAAQHGFVCYGDPYGGSCNQTIMEMYPQFKYIQAVGASQL